MVARGSDSTSIEKVNDLYSDFDIAHKYLGITCVPEVINSPLRQDNNPSLGLFINNRTNSLWFKDFGSGEKGSLYDLLAKMWNVSKDKVYERILKDMPVPALIRKRGAKVYRKSAGKIEVRVREWRDYDIAYWDSYGVSLPWLKFGEIYPISHIIITKNGHSYPIPAEKYAYVYVERKDGIVSFKIYQPYSKEYKWMSKHDSSVWDLWTKIPEKGDKLIITSSRKDALAIWSNTGIPALSLQGEGYIPKKHVVQQLKDRYNKVYVLYDDDFQSEENHGRMYGKMIAERFNVTQIEIPEKWESKDPSDLVKNHGREVLREVIYELVN